MRRLRLLSFNSQITRVRLRNNAAIATCYRQMRGAISGEEESYWRSMIRGYRRIGKIKPKRK